jgi:CRP-like cAMP-binding protein
MLSELARSYPVTIRNAIDMLCLEVRQRDITTAIASLKDARGRIGCSLLQLARQFGVPDGRGIRIDYPLTRQHIADRSGVTVETAIRVLSELQQQAVVQTENQIIRLLDVERIREDVSCDGCQFECSVFAQRRARRGL